MGPCFECKKRTSGCHDTCCDYIDWKVKHTAVKTAERAYYSEFAGYTVQRMDYLVRSHKISAKRKVSAR